MNFLSRWKIKNNVVLFFDTGNERSMYLTCKLSCNSYVPFRIYPNCKVALLRKTVFSNCQDTQKYMNTISKSTIQFSGVQFLHQFSTSINARTIWAVEININSYVIFYIENSNISLLNKNLLSLGYALFNVEHFINDQ